MPKGPVVAPAQEAAAKMLNPTQTNERHSSPSSDVKSTSPNSSPRSSPRPSPRPQTKREHNRSSDSHLNISKESISGKLDSSPASASVDLSASFKSTNSDLNVPIPDYNRSESTGSAKEKKESSRTKKKSAWYNVLYPTYKSRSEDYKKIFKEVPDEERLVVDYSSALQKEILVHGRLYVSQNYLCFYANIFGWGTTVTIKWKDVSAITKEKTALVIPNAILIVAKNEKYFFTSFVARDKTFLMLFRVWQNALLDQPMTTQEMWQWVHQCYGDELGLTSDDEDYIAPGGVDEEKLSGRLSVDSFQEECTGITLDMTDQTQASSAVVITAEEQRQKQETETREQQQTNATTTQDDDNSPTNNNGGVLNLPPTDLSDSSESDPEKIRSKLLVSNRRRNSDTTTDPSQPIQNSPDIHPSQSSSDEKLYPICTALHEGKQLINEVFPLHVDQLFTLLFTSSKFFLDFHASRKTSDLTQTPWTHNVSTNNKTRTINLTIPLHQAIGPKSAQVTETQVMLPCSRPGYLYAIDVEIVNGGIPYADSFYCSVHYCLHKISETQTSMAVYAQIKYKKFVWGLVKGMIEKNSWQGLEDFYCALTKALNLEAEEATIATVKRKSRRRRRPSIPRVSEEIRPIRGSIIKTKAITSPNNDVRTDLPILIVFVVLLALVVLNVMLYVKLWSLEATSPYTLIDLHVLKDPPKTHDDWVKLLQQQETLHTVEMQKWQRILKTAIQLLRETEESLNQLQRSIHPTYTEKIMSIVQNRPANPRATDEL